VRQGRVLVLPARALARRKRVPAQRRGLLLRLPRRRGDRTDGARASVSQLLLRGRRGRTAVLSRARAWISVFGGVCECGCAASERHTMLPSLAACDAFRRLRGVPISGPTTAAQLTDRDTNKDRKQKILKYRKLFASDGLALSNEYVNNLVALGKTYTQDDATVRNVTLEEVRGVVYPNLRSSERRQATSLQALTDEFQVAGNFKGCISLQYLSMVSTSSAVLPADLLSWIVDDAVFGSAHNWRAQNTIDTLDPNNKLRGIHTFYTMASLADDVRIGILRLILYVVLHHPHRHVNTMVDAAGKEELVAAIIDAIGTQEMENRPGRYASLQYIEPDITSKLKKEPTTIEESEN